MQNPSDLTARVYKVPSKWRRGVDPVDSRMENEVANYSFGQCLNER